jgi:trehalose 6-phosphate phosphatase
VTAELSDPIELAAQLGPAQQRLLALDFDGVLAPIVDHPDLARPAPETVAAVGALAELTVVAIVSGRPIIDLQGRVGQLPVIWAGGHGAEIVGDDGREVHLVDVAEVAPALDEVEADLGALVDGEAGWLIERKAASLAVHHRLADPERVEELLPRVTAQLESRRDRSPGFDVLHGKSVVELRPSGTDKGAALAHLAERHPDRSPLVLGDDTTDEDAFRAAIHHGGTGVLVADAPRETAAQHRLADPAAVTTFLTALAQRQR